MQQIFTLNEKILNVHKKVFMNMNIFKMYSHISTKLNALHFYSKTFKGCAGIVFSVQTK